MQKRFQNKNNRLKNILMLIDHEPLVLQLSLHDAKSDRNDGDETPFCASKSEATKNLKGNIDENKVEILFQVLLLLQIELRTYFNEFIINLKNKDLFCIF